MSAVPFRLKPCTDPAAADFDALSFGNPALYSKLSGLGRVEIQAGTPPTRAGTIWYRIDQQYCFVEAVAIREGMYPLVYKVLPEMMAAQLGYSFVGRYFSMTYGYATRSLIWDDKAISENGAKSYSSVYPGMWPILKLTAILAGSTRTPLIVRNDQDSAGAAADALLLGDTSLANKLADVARLEVVTGSEGTRAGTIWYFRNGNYCFVIAAAFRPEAPADAVRLAPLLVAQFFGYNFVGNYTAIPADIKDKALCWDRETSSPLPALAPLSERLAGVQDFVVTFDDGGGVNPNPNPDPDPYPPVVCESPDNHRWEAGWNYDGCYWTYQNSPGSDYSWSSNPDGLGGSWNQNTTPTDPPSSPGDGYNWDGYNWYYVGHDCANGATWNAPSMPVYWGTSAYGSWTCNEPPTCDNPEDHRWQSGWNWDGCHWSESLSPGSDYSWSSNSDGLGGSWNYSGYSGGGGNPYPSYGTELGSDSSNITVNVGCGDWVVGSNSWTNYADGNGGSYQGNQSTSYVSSGTYLGNCNEQNYYSDGTGGYYTGA